MLKRKLLDIQRKFIKQVPSLTMLAMAIVCIRAYSIFAKGRQLTTYRVLQYQLREWISQMLHK